MNHKSEEKTSQTIEGVIMTTSRGVGYVEHPHPEQEDRLKEDQDIEIQPENMHTALNGDTVKVVLLPYDPKKDRRLQGEVVEILERGKTQYVGTVEVEGGVCFLNPDDRKMYTNIFIDKKAGKKPEEGYKAVVEFLNWSDDKKTPRGRIIQILGKHGEHDVEMKSILIDKGIEYDFPPHVEQEAEDLRSQKNEFLKEALSKRRDLRNVTTFTIDPQTAKDFDDALSVTKRDDGNFEIGVHIADVSHYVKKDSALDNEARDRLFSVYLVDRTIPMLPEALSNDLCSLNPNEEKLAFSGIFTITPEGNVLDRWFGKTVIRSDRRFTYRQAQNDIDSQSGDFYEELQILNNLAKILRQMRFSSGAINFSSEEVEFELDETGKPIDVHKKKRLDTHELIEEFMLLCNREVAKEIYRMTEKENEQHPFLYRVHELPDREKLEDLAVFVRAMGYDFSLPDDEKVSGKDINALLQKAEGKAEEGLINTALIRSMAKAVYSTKSEGHFGLAFEYYTHFTSPIRRYPDLTVHRLLQKHLNDESISSEELGEYKKVAAEASAREREILEAERESIKYKQVEFMQEKEGEEFDAVISGVSEYGVYVEEKHTKAEGMVRVSSMNDDYYELDRENYSLVGRDSGKKYTLGQDVRVKLVRANLERKELDFVFVE